MTMIKTNRKRRFKGTLVLDYGDLVGAVMGLQYIFRRYDENYTTPQKNGDNETPPGIPQIEAAWPRRK